MWWDRNVADPSKDVLIVLAWSDPTDSFGTTAINDLHLHVIHPDIPPPLYWDEHWHGNNFEENQLGQDTGYSHMWAQFLEEPLYDEVNNVEVVFIPAGPDRVRIKVIGSSVDSGDLPFQDFAIYAYNVEYEP